MHILLIEDDERISGYVAKALREEGHLVDVAADGRSGLTQATSEAYDVIVLDRMLPQVDGLKVLHALRGMDDTTPVLILSALGDADERVRGLRAGGDDYLAKPFSIEELVARVEVLGRRRGQPELPARHMFDDLLVDPVARVVSRAGKRIELTNREFRILEYLARNAGRVVTRSMLLEHVWDYNFDPQTNIIDQHVSRLRQKLERVGGEPLIETVRGAGYSIRRGSA
ncbi:MAG TPA: response regulator transcription factor [Croceibacterium sp.]